jgi:hypothetical protein
MGPHERSVEGPTGGDDREPVDCRGVARAAGALSPAALFQSQQASRVTPRQLLNLFIGELHIE